MQLFLTVGFCSLSLLEKCKLTRVLLTCSPSEAFSLQCRVTKIAFWLNGSNNWERWASPWRQRLQWCRFESHLALSRMATIKELFASNVKAFTGANLPALCTSDVLVIGHLCEYRCCNLYIDSSSPWVNILSLCSMAKGSLFLLSKSYCKWPKGDM